MQFTTIAATLMAATMAVASPAARNANAPVARDYGSVRLTFWAAAENTYDQWVPTDGVEHAVGSVLSFTYISNHGSSSCTAYGVDKSITVVPAGAQNVPIGPPQQQKTVRCY